MKRLLVMLIAVGFLVALPQAHSLQAKPSDEQTKPIKVAICHVNSANDVVDVGGEPFVVFGRVIEVPQKAVATHEEHGDSQDFQSFDADVRDAIEEILGIELPNADCIFNVE
jgi:hypothetical protein